MYFQALREFGTQKNQSERIDYMLSSNYKSSNRNVTGALTLLIFEKSYSQNWIKSTELIIEDLLLKINGFYSNFRQNIV